jgi:predicted nucleic acid-binding protein
MYLIDTNIFLEILLNDSNSEKCETFLDTNIDNLHISDFSLHSIGIILYRTNKPELYLQFVLDIIPKIQVVTLPPEYHFYLDEGRITYHFDFDDAYQYGTAKYHGLNLETQDHDFEFVTDITVEFL